jgi:hypothetical protein
MKILITGNPNFGLAKELGLIYPNATFVSRNSNIDLTSLDGHKKLAELVLSHDVFINSSALWKFNQTVLLDTVYKKCIEEKHSPYIICLGSTTDRVKKGSSWLYNAEKKALRDYCNSLGLNSVWQDGPKITYISFGTLSNNQEKHPERKTIDIGVAAKYIQWLVEQPKEICINEISIDPMQNQRWYNE